MSDKHGGVGGRAVALSGLRLGFELALPNGSQGGLPEIENGFLLKSILNRDWGWVSPEP